MPKTTCKEKSYLPLILVLVLFIGLTWVGTIYLVPKFYGAPDGAGTFGDMFGSLNAIFSGLAFVGVIVAILLQKKELELQRQELEETREELKGQKLQLEEQNITLRKQSFENTFFQFLKLYNDIVDSVDIDSNYGYNRIFSGRNGQENPPITGRDGFVKLYSRFSGQVLREAEQEEKTSSNIVVSEIISRVYERFYEENQSDLGHYYRTIYNLIKFVNNSEIENKKFYTDILRAQLSSHELLLLHYNSQSSFGNEKMLPYLISYNLLKHMPNKETIEVKYNKKTEISEVVREAKLRSPQPSSRPDC